MKHDEFRKKFEHQMESSAKDFFTPTSLSKAKAAFTNNGRIDLIHPFLTVAVFAVISELSNKSGLWWKDALIIGLVKREVESGENFPIFVKEAAFQLEKKTLVPVQ